MDPTSDPFIEIFNKALEVPPPERPACLQRACEGDDGLRKRVENLLRAHDDAGDFLEEAVSLLPVGTVVGEGPGQRIGRYKLLEQIGEGGCGVVFMAEQEKPVRRRVALKVVKPGMDTRSVIARFESERQALAVMDHPSIAQVFDAGATEAGRPYFVMELVPGVKITDYCDRHGLTIKGRLELFVEICHAVQHAHQKGIIHRDIKPSNILVSATDGEKPLPKVIDFGIAKAVTGQRLSDRTLFTAFELLVGTPTYMSPEQAALKSADLDTRTDIYSLGVLLYELLAGTTPFDVRDLFKAGLDEVRRDILDREPPRPSARLKAMPSADLAQAAEERALEPARLIRLMRGDLDWIVMKALEKDRRRRYPTANALATDVQRFLADEPVMARPPSTRYQLGKLISRNRLLVGSLATIAVLLVTSMATMAVLLAREQDARQQAEVEKAKANVEATKSKEVSSFMTTMFAGATPSVAMGRDTALLKDILKDADEKVGSDLVNQPAVEAELRLALCIVYGRIGELEAAERMGRRAVELRQKTVPLEPRGLATAMNRLGNILLHRNQHEESERYLQAALDLWRSSGSANGREAVLTLENLAMLRWRQGKLQEAESLMKRVCDWRRENMPAGDEDILSASNNLATVMHSANKHAEAEKLLREVVAGKDQIHGKDHPGLRSPLMNLASVLATQGKVEERKVYVGRVVELDRKFLEAGHPDRSASTLLLANLHRSTGEFVEAESLYREVLRDGRKTPEDYNPQVLGALRGLCTTLYARGMSYEVEALLAGILVPEFSRSGRSVPVMEAGADILARAGDWSGAAMYAAKLVELEPENHEHYHMLAPLLVAAGKVEDYQKLCAEILRRFSYPTDIFIADQMAKDCLIRPQAVENLAHVVLMADAVLRQGDGYDALPFFQANKSLADYRQGRFADAVAIAEKVSGAIPHAEVAALTIRAMAAHRMDRAGEAAMFLAKAAAAFESKLPKLESGDLGQDWRDWIIARELLTEARALIGEPAR